MGAAFLYSPELRKPGSSLAKAPVTILKPLQLSVCFLNTQWAPFGFKDFAPTFPAPGIPVLLIAPL